MGHYVILYVSRDEFVTRSMFGRFGFGCHGVCYSFIVLSLYYRFVLRSLWRSLFIFANLPASKITVTILTLVGTVNGVSIWNDHSRYQLEFDRDKFYFRTAIFYKWKWTTTRSKIYSSDPRHPRRFYVGFPRVFTGFYAEFPGIWRNSWCWKLTFSRLKSNVFLLCCRY